MSFAGLAIVSRPGWCIYFVYEQNFLRAGTARPSKSVLGLSYPDESIRNVGEPESRKPFSPTSSEHSAQRSWKAFQTTGTAVRKVGGGRPRTTTARDDRYNILQAKRGASQERQSASVIAQQRADKCRGLVRPDAFKKGAYSPAVLNAVSH
ncbi:uncharacterized protein TNCV_3624401 [Trichonephila clavipes]|nr:uncharacterized protein TNCV_3624401 [Trichonephila clavipes]